jgi:hypothetical protein
VRVADRDLLRDIPAARRSEQHSRLQVHRVQERLDISGKVLQSVPAGGLVGVPVAALVHRQNLHRSGQQGQKSVEAT